MDRFHLRQVGVVQGMTEDAPTLHDPATTLSGEILDSLLVGARSLGISWGTTVHQIAHAFAPRHHHDVRVIQMMGGVGSTDPAIDGPAVAQRLAHALTNRYHYLHAPLIVDSPTTARALLAQRTVAETLNLAAQVDVALVGIGALDPTVSSLLRAGFLTQEEFHTIETAGVVGDICARHFDINGRAAAPEIDKRLIGINLEQLALIPIVMAVACGAAKARAILGALRGNYVDVLITDASAAKLVLTLADELDAQTGAQALS
ncbi:MAG: hypothetical protein NVS2B7_38070 [Herpetosiphon sp.]